MRSSWHGNYVALPRLSRRARRANVSFPSENLDPGEMARGAADSGIPREESGVQGLGQSYVGGVVGGEVLPQGPDPGQQDAMGIPLDGEVREGLEGQGSPRLCHLPSRDETAQGMGDFDIQEVRRVKRRAYGEEAFADRGTDRGLQKDFQDGRGVEDDHRRLAAFTLRRDRFCHGLGQFHRAMAPEPLQKFLRGRA